MAYPITDVQLTKDLQPVIFHDFYICTQVGHYQVAGMDYQELIDLALHGREPSDPQPNPFYDGSECKKCNKPEQNYRLTKGPIPTLEQAFKETEPVAFNIEIKYPTQDEIEDWQLATPIPVDEYCRRIVQVIPPVGRAIVISSFHPEVCAWVKQNTKHSVMFLTDAGETVSRHDPRLSSLDAAFTFARDSGFDGIVANSAGLLKADRNLITAIAIKMALYSYGKENCLVDAVQMQVNRGVTGIITDDLVAIAPLLSSKLDL